MDCETFQKECRDYLNTRSPLRKQPVKVVYITPYKVLFVSSINPFYYLKIYDKPEIKECPAQIELHVPIVEISCNPSSKETPHENLFSEETMNSILQEEIKFFNLIKVYPGDPLAAIIRWDVTALITDVGKEYGITVFENLAITKGLDIDKFIV